jgi:methionine--tRNA ligase beta chain
MITIDDFAKVDMRVGLVEEATNKEGSEKLIRLVVDFGPEIGKRVIFTAVRPYGFTPDFFQGKKFLFLTNLEFKKIMDEESQGMILATDSENGPVFLDPGDNSIVGSTLR